MKTIAAQVIDPTHLELKEPLSLDSGVQISVVIQEDADAATTAGRPETSRPLGFREREHAWRRSHGQVLRAFEGEWVVLEGEAIVEHGEDPVKLVERARSRGIPSPYIFYVEPRGPGVVKIGL